MITSTEDGAYRVSCLDIDCPRPLARTVATMSHAANLERKHEREFHPQDGTKRGDLIALLRSRTFGGRNLNEVQSEEIADMLIAANYCTPPL